MVRNGPPSVNQRAWIEKTFQKNGASVTRCRGVPMRFLTVSRCYTTVTSSPRTVHGTCKMHTFNRAQQRFRCINQRYRGASVICVLVYTRTIKCSITTHNCCPGAGLTCEAFAEAFIEGLSCRTRTLQCKWQTDHVNINENVVVPASCPCLPCSPRHATAICRRGIEVQAARNGSEIVNDASVVRCCTYRKLALFYKDAVWFHPG